MMHSGSSIALSLLAPCDRWQRLQFTTNLTQPNWTDSGSPITATNASATASELCIGEPAPSALELGASSTTNVRGSAKRNAAFTLQHGAMLTPRQPEGCVPAVVSRCGAPVKVWRL